MAGFAVGGGSHRSRPWRRPREPGRCSPEQARRSDHPPTCRSGGLQEMMIAGRALLVIPSIHPLWVQAVVVSL